MVSSGHGILMQLLSGAAAAWSPGVLPWGSVLRFLAPCASQPIQHRRREGPPGLLGGSSCQAHPLPACPQLPPSSPACRAGEKRTPCGSGLFEARTALRWSTCRRSRPTSTAAQLQAARSPLHRWGAARLLPSPLALRAQRGGMAGRGLSSLVSSSWPMQWRVAPCPSQVWCECSRRRARNLLLPCQAAAP